MKIVFSWDDRSIQVEKLMNLHLDYGIPGMFFVPTYNCEGRSVIKEEIIRNANKEFITFGGHTSSHRYLTLIPPSDVESEIRDNKEYLEQILGYELMDFCLPGGKYNPQILEKCFKYFKTVRTTDTMCFQNESNLIKPTFHFYPRTYHSRIGNCMKNGAYFELTKIIFHPKEPVSNLIERFLSIENKKDSTILIWGHSWEIEKLDLWDSLEDLFGIISNQYYLDCKPYSSLRHYE